jgi:hypothetical protein
MEAFQHTPEAMGQWGPPFRVRCDAAVPATQCGRNARTTNNGKVSSKDTNGSHRSPLPAEWSAGPTKPTSDSSKNLEFHFMYFC